jgi:lipooligosaccharide transport system permease protein
VQWVAKAAPLWHGVVLARGSTVGGLRPMTAIGHVAYLLLWAGVGTIVATRRLRRVLYV